jgi:hypothetical protein
MAVVRLQCPACAAVVKISEIVASQHPVVRCAQCQGLVNVATTRMPDAKADPVEPRVSKPKRKKKAASQFPVKAVVGGVVGLLVFVGVGIGIYFLITSLSGPPTPEKFMQKTVATLEKMVTIVEGMKTVDDVPAAVQKLVKSRDELLEFAKMMPKDVKPTEDDMKKMMEYLPKLMDLQNRIKTAMMKNPEVALALAREGGQLAGGMNSLFSGAQNPFAAMQGGGNPGGNNPFNPGMMGGNGRPNFPSSPPPSGGNTNSSPLSAEEKQQQDFEHMLVTRRSQAGMIPGALGDIRDSSDGDHAFFVIENLVKSLKENDDKLQALRRQNVRAKSQFARDAEEEIEKTIREIGVHMARIEKLNNIGNLPSRLIRQLDSVGLYRRDTTTASNNDPPANGNTGTKDDTNPFQPTTPASGGNKSTADNTKPGENPFEPVKGGNMEKPAGGNASNDPNNSLYDSAIGKLTSTEHFKKQEGIREANSLKTSDARRKEVLDALFGLFEDADVHNKADLLKAYKKWAASQEDKERLGQVAESLLKDTWTKKDALKYFGEAKIISTSKEVARLLRDNFERKEAAEALITMGSEAEKAVIPHLTDLEPQVRHMCIEVLARIGTKECLPELRKLQSDRQVGLAARQAIGIINKRGT